MASAHTSDKTLEVNGYATIVLEDAELKAVQALAAAAFGEVAESGGGGAGSSSGFFSSPRKRARSEKAATPDVGYRQVSNETNPTDDDGGLVGGSTTKEVLSYRMNHTSKSCRILNSLLQKFLNFSRRKQ